MPVSPEQIDSIEQRLGLVFPLGLKKIYLEFDESPASQVFPFENDGYVVRLLPLFGLEYSAVASYQLYLEKKLLKPNFFPFAYDPGGNDFCVDCSSAEGWVSFHCGEICDDEDEGIIDFGVGIQQFWASMVTPEEFEESDGKSSA